MSRSPKRKSRADEDRRWALCLCSGTTGDCLGEKSVCARREMRAVLFGGSDWEDKQRVRSESRDLVSSELIPEVNRTHGCAASLRRLSADWGK